MYQIETITGIVLCEMADEQDAILEVRQRLEDDPELGELYVALNGQYFWRATHAPDKNWDSVVVVIGFDEKIQPPSPYPLLSEEEFENLVNDAYADDWPKAEGMRQMREAGLC